MKIKNKNKNKKEGTKNKKIKLKKEKEKEGMGKKMKQKKNNKKYDRKNQKKERKIEDQQKKKKEKNIRKIIFLPRFSSTANSRILEVHFKRRKEIQKNGFKKQLEQQKDAERERKGGVGMIIMTQDREKIINFEAMDYIGAYNGYEIYAFKYDSPLCKIGKFETIKRAKDIVNDIYNSMESGCTSYYTPVK